MLCELLSTAHHPLSFTLLEAAEAEWRKEPLLINKWFTLQATATVPMDECPIVDVVQNLIERYPGYNAHNPNNVYSLVLAFCQNNLAEFSPPPMVLATNFGSNKYLNWIESIPRSRAAWRAAWITGDASRLSVLSSCSVHSNMSTPNPICQQI